MSFRQTLISFPIPSMEKKYYPFFILSLLTLGAFLAFHSFNAGYEMGLREVPGMPANL